MKKSENIEEIAKALKDFRFELKQPVKDASNPFFKSKYTTLDKVIEAIDQTAPNFGLSFTQWAVSNEQGNVGVETLLLHSSGQYIHYDALYMKPEKNTPQAIGSCLTYSRRYTISAIFGITSDEDDDGNQASGNQQQNNYQNKSQGKPKSPAQDQNKVLLLQTKAGELSDKLKANGKDFTPQQILESYNVKDIKVLTNEQLIELTKKITSKIDDL